MRKLIEEAFGWAKTIAGVAKVKVRAQQNATPHPSWPADPSPPPKRIRNRLLTTVRQFMTQ
jgi:hypothetical protein